MSTDYPELFVTADWLKENLQDPSLRIVDGSWHLPAAGKDDAGRNARAEFDAEHIPGAVFFDIDSIADRTSPLPHMLPAPGDFAAAAGALGIAEDDTIVVYDSLGLFSAARVWWTFTIMGAEKVRILEGGLPAWKKAGGSLRDAPSSPKPAHFHPVFNKRRVLDLADMRHEVADPSSLVLDARPAARFTGEEPEPREGVASGHIPGAVNLPASDLVDDGRLVARDRLEILLAASGVEPGRPVITTCGSGVTAAILSLGLAAIDHDNRALYDGSWAEWGSRHDTEIETGHS